MSRVAAVVLNFRKASETIACAQDLVSQQDLDRVLVVDNGSGADVVSAVQRGLMNISGAEVIGLPRNLGYSGGNNVALRRIVDLGFDFALLVNNDVRITNPNLVAELISVVDGRPLVGIAAPLISTPSGALESAGLPDPTLTRLALASLRRRLDSRRAPQWPIAPTRVPAVAGTCWLIRTTVLMDVGYLDDGFFMYAEEQDFCRRARDRGWHVLLVPVNGVEHRPDPRRVEFPYAGYVNSRLSLVRYHRKHGGRLAAGVVGLGILASVIGRIATSRQQLRRAGWEALKILASTILEVVLGRTTMRLANAIDRGITAAP